MTLTLPRNGILLVLPALCAVALVGCSSSDTTAAPTRKAATVAPAATQAGPVGTAVPVTPGQPISGVPTSGPAATVAVPTKAPVILPTRAPTAEGRVYSCESGDCDCADFPTHAEAQRVYNKHGGNNWSRLDADLDGSACETLP